MNPRFMLSSSLQVLDDLLGTAGDRSWVMQRLALGGQAAIFLVHRPDGRPVWQTHQQLVVKVFDSSADDVDVAARDEYLSLHQLHEVLHGREINGWTIHCPLPLHKSEHPLALVMTAVPGRSLSYYVRESDELAAETLAEIGRTAIAALERYWTVAARIYGDANFHNILCDPHSRSLSLVDPGMPESSWLCEGVSRRWYPASRDAAYMLFSVAAAVKATLGNPTARRREKWLVRDMLQAALERIATADERPSLLDEIQACARMHVTRISSSWSPAGMWRAAVRRAADRCIEEILGSLRAEQPAAVQSESAVAGQEAMV
jgi:hypothetical protein